ncbi:MAG: hypothetical protein E6J91_19680 [Deltaproteobacteria bacterium]|nr:MAG: hypothetical protein E6J91_19680 [Deltaproteobacteria bacterium]
MCLLAFSRGEQPAILPATTRQVLLRQRWIAPGEERRHYTITHAGSDALATSPYRDHAERQLALNDSSAFARRSR